MNAYQRWYWQQPDNKARAKQYKLQKRTRRKYWLGKYKVAKGCYICGYNVDAVALDFDHIYPSTKDFAIGTRPECSLQTYFKEIRKCRVVCANCHRIHTHG